MSDIKLGCHVGMAGKDSQGSSIIRRECVYALHRGTTEHEKKGNL